jgi:exopolyphosphatase / guanosine-5'-triphosphate,3'-diphosphate pyrophosphatase
MRKAVIDLGTNTFNLLIADVQEGAFTVVLSTKEAVLLGMGGINDAKITQEAIDRAMKAFERFVQLCDAFEVERSQVVAIGTSALRDATNAAELLDKVRSEHRISIEIVSGIREAELIYKGVKWTDPFDEPAIIMDIGGGSTEFISADKEGIRSALSIDIGVSRVYQLFQRVEIYPETTQASIGAYFDSQANGRMSAFSSDRLIGASGSFETFYEMIFCEKWVPFRGIVELPMERLNQELTWTIQSTQTERDQHEWITPIRKVMLPIAAIQLRWAIEHVNCSHVLLSPYSLKEGVLH